MKLLHDLQFPFFLFLSCLLDLTQGAQHRHYKLCKKVNPFVSYYDVCFDLGFDVVNLDNLSSLHLVKMLSPKRQAWISTFQHKFFDKPMYVSSTLGFEGQKFLKLTVLLEKPQEPLKKMSLCFWEEVPKIQVASKNTPQVPDRDKIIKAVDAMLFKYPPTDDESDTDEDYRKIFGKKGDEEALSTFFPSDDPIIVDRLKIRDINNIQTFAIALYGFYLQKPSPQNAFKRPLEGVNFKRISVRGDRDVIVRYVADQYTKMNSSIYRAMFDILCDAGFHKLALKFAFRNYNLLKRSDLYAIRKLKSSDLSPKEWHFFSLQDKLIIQDDDRFLFYRLLAYYGPPKIRDEILASKSIQQLVSIQQVECEYDLSFLPIEIPEVDIAHADRPQIQMMSDDLRMTDAYYEFVSALTALIDTGVKNCNLQVLVYRKKIIDDFLFQRMYVDFSDAGGPTRSFLSTFGLLFKMHPFLLVDPNNQKDDGGDVPSSLVIHPMASEQVYSFMANLFGFLALYNHKAGTVSSVSIGWFLSTDSGYSEFLFDPNIDRFPTIEEVNQFFPFIERDFATCAKSPSDFGGFFDHRHEITLTRVINYLNIDAIYADVPEPLTLQNLEFLKRRYLEVVQLKLFQGHQIFIQNLNTFFAQPVDFESFELLFVRRGQLDAEEVLSAITVGPSCLNYFILNDKHPGLTSIAAAFPRMVREMTSEERANLFYFGLGCLPVIFKPGMLQIDCSGLCGSSYSWSSGSCSGYIYPPKQPVVPSHRHTYQTLFSSLKLQSAMDRGSTGGRENNNS